MNVLVTYGWCRTAYSVAMSLAKAGHSVSVCASSPLSMSRYSRFVRTFDLVPDPYADEAGYVAAVAAVAAKRNIAVIMPVHEDALAIQRHLHLLPATVKIASPGRDALELALDKWELLRTAAEVGVPIPRTSAPATIEAAERAFQETGFPLVIKPRRGNSGKGVAIAHDFETARDSYRALIARLRLDYRRPPIIQAFVAGDLVGSAFFADSGRLVACFTERYLRCKHAGFGTSVLREPYRNEELRCWTARLVERLHWHGAGHLDFIVPRNGSPVLIEMNPRFWGALQMSILNGYNFPLAVFEQTAFGNVKSECFTTNGTPARCLWIAGELIACVEELRHKLWTAPVRSALRIVSSGVFARYDDFRWDDPIPFLAELCYYGNGFVRSGCETNPIQSGHLG